MWNKIKKMIEKYKLNRELKVIRKFSKIMDKLNLLVLPIEKEYFSKVSMYYNKLLLDKYSDIELDFEIRVTRDKVKDKKEKPKVKKIKRKVK